MENVKVASLRLSESLANQVTAAVSRVKVPEFSFAAEEARGRPWLVSRFDHPRRPVSGVNNGGR
ncbi:hypothetical protein HGRIS_013920 [Hohenbuehelia grisea]|uniref:Uncharacterized protein n=1 Tax=Hohenbuehelia grisea TaxID=104357 RepID=A0ABR3JRU5_9AGAR